MAKIDKKGNIINTCWDCCDGSCRLITFQGIPLNCPLSDSDIREKKDVNIFDNWDENLDIEKWDEDNTSNPDNNTIDPIELLNYLMSGHKMGTKDLVKLLGIDKRSILDILHYKKRLSKKTIKILSSYFKVSQGAFDRHYKLKNFTKNSDEQKNKEK